MQIRHGNLTFKEMNCSDFHRNTNSQQGQMKG
jgi:hypothetical protein